MTVTLQQPFTLPDYCGICDLRSDWSVFPKPFRPLALPAYPTAMCRLDRCSHRHGCAFDFNRWPCGEFRRAEHVACTVALSCDVRFRGTKFQWPLNNDWLTVVPSTACDPKTTVLQLVTVEFAIDLGSGLRLGKPSLLFLPSNLIQICCYLCCSMYCLCINVYCTAATGWQPKLQLINISYHVIFLLKVRLAGFQSRLVRMR
jgi:hypothetical protein